VVTTSLVKVTQPPTDVKAWAKLILEFAVKKYSPRRDDFRQVIREARSVCGAIPYSRLGVLPIPSDASAEYVIEHTRPERRQDHFTDISRWLAAWLLRLIPDETVRKSALSLALQTVET
jgi:hypothetical protein